MYKGKHEKKITHMSKRAALLVLSLVMILSVTVGGTLAYLILDTQPVTNTFAPGEAKTEIDEPDWTDGDTVKRDVTVENTGNVPVCVRAKIVVAWAKDGADGVEVLPITPTDTDYTMIPASSETSYNGWTKGEDGYWYCDTVIEAEGRTPKLIDSCSPNVNNPDGAHLQVTVLSQAVQATKAALDEAKWERIPASVTSPAAANQ